MSEDSSPRVDSYRSKYMAENDETMSHSSGSREATPSEHEHDSSDVESETAKPALPSLTEFCKGRLPSSGSALDARIRDLGIGQPLPPPRSLSVLQSTNATFAWPSFAAASQTRGETYMMMNIRPSSSGSYPSSSHQPPYQSKEHPQFARLRRSSSASYSGSSQDYRLHYAAFDDNRASSIDSDSESSEGYGSPHLRPYERSCLLQGRSSRGHPRWQSRAQSYDSDMEMDLAPSTSASVQSVPIERSMSYSSSPDLRRDMAQQNPALGHSDADMMSSTNWEDYVEKAGRLNGAGPVMYTCRWKKYKDTYCNYTGKKQLAKRHVESVHLAKKPHVCPECKKPFPQKTSLDIHIRSVHTFDKPLKCEHCPACFSDPARRHKHYRVEHPDKVVKKPRVKLEFSQIKHLLVK